MPKPNECMFCKTTSQIAPKQTNWFMLVLGNNWFECCSFCYDEGEGTFIHHITGQEATFKELWQITQLLEDNQGGLPPHLNN